MNEDSTNKVASSIKGKCESLRALPNNRCIFRVPEYHRKLYEEAYRPFVVSIGPFYYEDSRLQAMKEQKLAYLQCFVERHSNKYSLEDYIWLVGEWEEEARECYAEKVSLSSQEFIEMILVDAAFIIELILRVHFEDLRVNDCLIFGSPELIEEVFRDLLLEENQLPFFILTRLYDLSCGMKIWSDDSQFTTLAYPLFERWGKFIDNVKSKRELVITTDIKHLVDLLRTSYLPSKLRPQLPPTDSHPKVKLSLSATGLKAAGVKFVTSKSKLLDLTFNKASGVLEIPKFAVSDETESTFRSMLIFEQFCCRHDSYITDYMIFLDELIETPKDVEILVKCHIIDNGLGSYEEVANFFNKINRGAKYNASNYYYAGVSRDLETYARTRSHKWRAILVQSYFGHPWAIISVIYALVLLILTMLHTVTSFQK